MTIDASSPPPLGDGVLTIALEWQRMLLDTWMLAQSSQNEQLATCQKAIEAYRKDLFDQWVCRFGGGVPLDG